MRATYRRVGTSYWTDPDVRRVCRTPEAHTVLLYLFTGPDSTLSGLYWQPLEDIALRTRIPIDSARELVERFVDKGFLSYDHATEEVFVRAAIKHQVGDEFRPTDNRWKAVLRDIANTHSDTLVAAIVEKYPAMNWPEEVRKRAEGAPKGLPPKQDAAIEGASEPEGGRGSEAKHAHTLVSKHTHTTEQPEKSDDVENSSEADRSPDDAAWLQVAASAARKLGLGKLSHRDEMTNRDIITAWRYREERSGVDALAAVEGAAMLRDEGTTWLKKGQSYTLKVLYKAMTLADQGDGKTVRPLWAVAQERYRRDDDKRKRKRTGGMDTIGAVFADLIPHPEA